MPAPRATDRAFIGQVVALVVATVAVALSLWYADRQVDDLRDQTRRFTRSYAELIGIVATDTTTTSSHLDLAIDEMIGQYDSPYVLTDTLGTPLSWRGIGVEAGVVDGEARQRIARQVAAFDRRYEPIPIDIPGAPELFHFGDPPGVRRLRVLPFLQLGLMVLVLGLVWWSLRAGVARQRSLVWVGLARESAHQFGTPLSSLQGWLDILRERQGGEQEAVTEVVEAMEEDLGRLGRITNRFAKLGAPVGDESVDLGSICERVTDYMRRRAPQRGGSAVTIATGLQPVPAVRGEEELLEWVVENLVKNAIDALGGRPGSISVSLRADGPLVRLGVEDDGPGVPPADQRRLFDPGYSTKRRGWGLGLALSRRLAEMHGGALELVRSRPGAGSLFEMTLPADREDSA